MLVVRLQERVGRPCAAEQHEVPLVVEEADPATDEHQRREREQRQRDGDGKRPAVPAGGLSRRRGVPDHGRSLGARRTPGGQRVPAAFGDLIRRLRPGARGQEALPGIGVAGARIRHALQGADLRGCIGGPP